MPSFKVVLGFLFIILIGLILMLGVLSYKSYQRTNSTAHLVQHSHEVLEHAEAISSEFKILQLESNAALVERDTTLFHRYSQARERTRNGLSELKLLTIDNLSQHGRAKRIETMIMDLVKITDSAFLMQPRATVNLRDRIAGNIAHRIRIQAAIDAFKNEENNLLSVRQLSNQEGIENFNRIFFALLSVVFVIVAATFLSIRHNFNKRIRVEGELTRANELFHKLFYDSPIALVISRPGDGTVVDCNAVYARLINYRRDEIIGQTAATLGILPPHVHREGIVRSAYEKGLAQGVEVHIQPKDKDPVWTNISIQPIRIKENEWLLSALQDISMHKEAESRIKDALEKEKELNRLKSDFVSLASHEFRTPLTTVLSSAFLLENYLPEDGREKTWKHLSRIKSSVNALTTILDEFLSLTKIEEGKMTPSREEVDLKSLLNVICKSQNDFTKTGQTIQFGHTGDDSVVSDAAMLTGIVTNLVSNSIKYSPESSSIRVASEVADGGFCVTVSDSGIGIPGEDQPHLFERFYRASNAGTVQGTGLGLHITKHYVDLLKGSIECISQRGMGTTFKVTFPEDQTTS